MAESAKSGKLKLIRYYVDLMRGDKGPGPDCPQTLRVLKNWGISEVRDGIILGTPLTLAQISKLSGISPSLKRPFQQELRLNCRQAAI